jgi:Type IV secretion-system coupling protein DNA-binding domain
LKQEEAKEKEKARLQALREAEQKEQRDKRDARTTFFDGIKLEDRERNIRVQVQREDDRIEDRERRLIERHEDREWREGDRQERQRIQAKNEQWHDETRQWRFEDREERQRTHEERQIEHKENREWQLEQRQRSERDRQDRETREEFERIYEQAQLDHHLHTKEGLFTPKPIPAQLRYEHVHILGPTGSGKTRLLLHLLLKDFRDYGREAAHIIIDPKGTMIDAIARLKIFDNEWTDRIVIVDPFDEPAFNVFALKGQNTAQLISNFAYIFATVGQKLTTPQETCFSYCAALLLKMPGANLTTLLELLEDGTGKPANRNEPPPRDPRFTALISSLTERKDQQLRRYFERDFYDTSRDLIKARINTILRDDTIAAMCNSDTCQINVADWIEKKKIVLVNTQFVRMGDTHQVLGRFIISLFQQAVLGRTSQHPAFLFIDEFQEFADEQKTPQLLRLIREYKAGAVIAHQNMVCTELTANSQAAISTNTIIKFASSPGADDLTRASKDLRCDPDFLTRVCRKEPDNSLFRFGCFFPGLDHPFVYQIGHEIQRHASVSHERYLEIRAQNRAALRDPPNQKTTPDPLSQRGTEATAVAREPPKSAGSYNGATKRAEAEDGITPTQQPSLSARASNMASSTQDLDPSAAQTRSDPSAPARWGQSKK